MTTLQLALLDLIRSIAENPDDVLIKEIEGHPIAFEIRISLRDYALVMSKLIYSFIGHNVRTHPNIPCMTKNQDPVDATIIDL